MPRFVDEGGGPDGFPYQSSGLVARIARLQSKKSVQFATEGTSIPVQHSKGPAQPAKQKDLLRVLKSRTRLELDEEEEEAGDLYSLRTPELESSLRSIRRSHARPSFTNEEWRFHLNYARLQAYRQRINEFEAPADSRWRTEPPQLSQPRGPTWRSEPNLQWPLQSIERHLVFGLRGAVLSKDVGAAPQAVEVPADNLPRRKSVSLSRRIQYAAYTH
mmetsp:Transcript_10828/g.24526  ORF Transcript_10828/g.24526 Transcript_10828/m.24526 type:complete len:217 (-) Transcript_10828:51-701(-)